MMGGGIVSVARSRWGRALLKTALAAVVIVFAFRALGGYGHTLAGRLEHVRLGWLAVAFVLSIVYRVVNAFGWTLVLRALGQRLDPIAGARMWLVSETLRWLPGSVWSMFSRVTQATRAGVPAILASLSLPLELSLTIGAWLATAGVGLAASGAPGAWATQVPMPWVVGFAAGLFAVVAGGVAIVRWAPSLAISRKVRGLRGALGELQGSRLRVGWLFATATLFTALCVFNGVAFQTVIRAVSDVSPGWAATIGINAAGWLVGFFAFFAPAGVGVREGGMTAMLAPLMPVDAALVAVLLWRVVQIAVEGVCLAACFAPAGVSAIRRLLDGAWAEI